MQVKVLQNAPVGAFCNTLTFIKLPFAIMIFVLSIFERLLKTGFTVLARAFAALIHKVPI